MATKSKPKTTRTNSRKSRSAEFDQAQFVLDTYRNAQEMSRALLHSRLGTQFGGKRDLYKTFGYPLDPDYHDYRNLYDRHGLAARVIDKFAESTWGKPPVLIDGDGRSDDLGQQATPFLVEWDKLVKRLQAWQIFQQADIMCGIGKYSIIFLGAPGDSYAQPAPDNGLFYLMSYDESQAGITQFIQDTNNEKFGMPAEYTVQFNSVDQGVNFTGGSAVHYSRVIHVSEHRLGSRIYGRPRLQTVLNRLFDLEKVTGGGAEAAWLAVYKGILLLPKEGFSTPEKDSPVMKNLDEQMTKLMNQIQRYAVVDGADVHDLGVEEVRIRDIYDTLKTDFAGSIGIPQRILFGAERGELASTQDQQEWNATIKSRQTNFAQPEILEPFIQWSIQHKIIPPPASGKYDIEWPPVYTMNEMERANYALVVAQGANTITGGVPDEAISIDEWRGELGMPPKPNPLDVLPLPQTIPANVPIDPVKKLGMISLPDLLNAGGNGNGNNGHGLAVQNEFEDHAGRPGKVGGSVPRDGGGGGVGVGDYIKIPVSKVHLTGKSVISKLKNGPRTKSAESGVTSHGFRWMGESEFEKFSSGELKYGGVAIDEHERGKMWANAPGDFFYGEGKRKIYLVEVDKQGTGSGLVAPENSVGLESVVGAWIYDDENKNLKNVIG